MSVSIKILHERDVEGREYGEPAIREPGFVSQLYGVIGHVVVAVVKQSDGAITLEREISVNADSADDNELAESVIKRIERKLNEEFPDPNQQVPEAKLWVPE